MLNYFKEKSNLNQGKTLEVFVESKKIREVIRKNGEDAKGKKK